MCVFGSNKVLSDYIYFLLSLYFNLKLYKLETMTHNYIKLVFLNYINCEVYWKEGKSQRKELHVLEFCIPVMTIL